MIQNRNNSNVSSGYRQTRFPSTSSAFLKRQSCRPDNRKQTTTSFQNGGMEDDFSDFFNDKVDEHGIEILEDKLNHNQLHDTGSMSYEQMWELQKIIDRRVKCKLSAGLSPEGRKAMEMAKAEVNCSNRKGKKTSFSNRDSFLPDLELPSWQKRGKVKKKISFVDAYESSSASRFSGDLMDENSSDGNPRRWALGGGNIGVAMETVEIVSFGDTSSSEADDLAIEETAKLNSVEKCLVWMGVHSEDDFEQR